MATRGRTGPAELMDGLRGRRTCGPAASCAELAAGGHARGAGPTPIAVALAPTCCHLSVLRVDDPLPPPAHAHARLQTRK